MRACAARMRIVLSIAFHAMARKRVVRDALYSLYSSLIFLRIYLFLRHSFALSMVDIRSDAKHFPRLEAT
jgi:hypothetical protein